MKENKKKCNGKGIMSCIDKEYKGVSGVSLFMLTRGNKIWILPKEIKL